MIQEKDVVDNNLPTNNSFTALILPIIIRLNPLVTYLKNQVIGNMHGIVQSLIKTLIIHAVNYSFKSMLMGNLL